LSTKYTCPEAARERFETSPLIHAKPKWRSTSRRAELTSNETGSTGQEDSLMEISRFDNAAASFDLSRT
jgi:hypothetical protein